MSQKDLDTESKAGSASTSPDGNDTPKKQYEMPDNSDELLDSVDAAARRPLTSTLIKIVVGALLICAIAMFISSAIKYSELKVERQRLEQEISMLEEDIEEKEYLLSISATDKEYVVRIAKEILRLFLPDEIVFYSDLNS